jgi:hypothetical protein
MGGTVVTSIYSDRKGAGHIAKRQALAPWC